MRLELSVVTAAGAAHDVVVHADPRSTVGEVIAQTAVLDTGVPAAVDGRVLDPGVSLATSGLASGDVIRQDSGGWPAPPEAPAIVVVGGIDAGNIHPVRPGNTYVIGRSATTDIVVDDPLTSRSHASVEIRADGSLTLTPQPDAKATFANGRPVTGPTEVPPGGQFVLGQAVLTLMTIIPRAGSVQVSEDGVRSFNRITRYTPPAPAATRIELPHPPGEQAGSNSKMQLVSSGAMVVAGIAMAVVIGSVLFAVAGVLMSSLMFATNVTSMRSGKGSQARRTSEYQQKLAETRIAVEAAAATQRDQASASMIDTPRAVLAALVPTTDLWSSDPRRPDAMTVRVGTHDRRAGIELTGQPVADLPVPTLVAVPVGVDLRSHPVLGISGPEPFVSGIARAIVHQLAVTRGPDDLLVVHLSVNGGSGWEWLRWLPHTRGSSEDVHSVSPGPAAFGARLAELTDTIAQRQQLRTFDYGRAELLLPEILVVVEDAYQVRSQAGFHTLVTEGPAVGIRIIAVDIDDSRLPGETTARILVTADRGPYLARIETQGEAAIAQITPDGLSAARAERSARAVASLHPLGGSGAESLPDSVRYNDLVGFDIADAGAVRQAWASGNEASALLGVDAGGSPRTISLPKDGPHALVAGTSGSGKSELLRTMLTGFALSAPPSELNLFLIDYKGGGALGRFKALPHVVGYADNLTIGGVLAERLLLSLKAELLRRMALFKDADNAEDISRYREVRRRRPELPKVTRLVVVVDEFAQLKSAVPDFVERMVDIAQVGRSLGMHVILATQQPAGIVTPQIEANIDLRICLRVREPGTSNDIVGDPVAGRFPKRAVGRAAIGADDQVTVVQTGYISAPARDASAAERQPVRVEQLPWARCGVTPPGAEEEDDDEASATDLSRFVDAAVRAAAGTDGTAPPELAPPWLPPLPDVVPMQAVLDRAIDLPATAIPFGMEDMPAAQQQIPACFVLGRGNLAIGGGGVSGRSTALQTLAGSMATRMTADELHLYVLDLTATGPLLRLARLPHCGTAAGRRDPVKATQLLSRVGELLETRAALLALHDVTTFEELLEAHGPLAPRIVVLVDGWDMIAGGSGTDEVLRSQLIALAVDGPTMGVQLVVAGGKALATGKLIGTFDSIVCLRFEQNEDMSLFKVPRAAVPAEVPPGQGRRPTTGDVVQIAVLGADPSAATQRKVLDDIAAEAAQPRLHHPIRIDEMPSSITLAAACDLPCDGEDRPSSVVVGVGGDELTGRTLDLTGTRGQFVIAGSPGSGRTNALAVIASQLDRAGVTFAVVIADGADSERFPGMRVGTVSDNPDLRRITALLIDNTERLSTDDQFMLKVLQTPDLAVVLTGAPDSFQAFMGWRSRLTVAGGLLLTPRSTTDAAAFGFKLEHTRLLSGPRGRAYLAAGPGRPPQLVQVPLIG